VILDVQAVLLTPSGKNLFKNLFREFELGQVPAVGMEGNLLFEYMGHLRAGNSIFKLAAEANPDVAGSLLAQIEKERYAKIQSDAQTGRS
jgi:hypothetical protein